MHTSSVGIYGHVQHPPAREGSPKDPQTVYERTKLAGEAAALEAAEATGLDLVIVRPGWVYGPGCPRTAKLVRALSKRMFFYVGDGSNLRHPIFIGDMVDGFLAAAEALPTVAGRAYVIAGPRPMALREYISTLARLLGVREPFLSMPRSVALGLAWGAELGFGLLNRDPPFSRRSLAFFENDSAFDIGAARRDLTFRPAVDVEDGLRRTLAAMREGAAAA